MMPEEWTGTDQALQAMRLKTAHAFIVPSGRHALRTYTDDATTKLATSGRTLWGYAARTARVRRRLWGHLEMRGFIRSQAGTINTVATTGHEYVNELHS